MESQGQHDGIGDRLPAAVQAAGDIRARPEKTERHCRLLSSKARQPSTDFQDDPGCQDDRGPKQTQKQQFQACSEAVGMKVQITVVAMEM